MESNYKAKTLKKSFYIILVIMIINLLISISLIIHLCIKENKTNNFQNEILEASDKYLLYIGLNDKNTNNQEIATKEARTIINSICLKYIDGYTVAEAKGGWTDETGLQVQENTLVYTIYCISEETLTKIMDEIIIKLNQSSILVEVQKSYYTYYGS